MMIYNRLEQMLPVVTTVSRHLFDSFARCLLSVHSQISEVMDTMKDNIDKVVQRGDKIEELQGKSGQ